MSTYVCAAIFFFASSDFVPHVAEMYDFVLILRENLVVYKENQLGWKGAAFWVYSLVMTLLYIWGDLLLLLVELTENFAF